MYINTLNRYRVFFNIIQDPLFFMKEKKYIFILSHMRSYSTLLSHILANNSEVCGYTEMHQPYYSTVDLYNLKLKAKQRYGKNTNKKYILDKILHNAHTISDNILRNKDLHTVFLLRKPMDTLKSIIKIRSNPDAVNTNNDETVVKNYYIKRLERLIELSNLTKGKNYFIISENIIENTEETLHQLSKFLNLNEELAPDYETFQYTGTKEYGDTSEYIKKGEIIRDRGNSDVQITKKFRIECEAAYEKCLNILKENSINNN